MKASNMKYFFSDGKIVKKMRAMMGIEKPYALPWSEWDEWKEKIKAEKPIAYFMTETLPIYTDRVIDAVTSPYYDVRYYFRNRFIRKSHILRTNCKPGDYMDTDEKILSALANAIIDHVEIELAYKSKWCELEESKTAVWKNGRCPELGLKYLAWEATLIYDIDSGIKEDHEDYMKPTPQADAAKEIRVIYDWAKNRDSRPDPYDASGWTAYSKKNLKNIFNLEQTEEMSQERDTALEKCNEIEDAYEKEDTDMLMRIIKIRGNLWT